MIFRVRWYAPGVLPGARSRRDFRSRRDAESFAVALSREGYRVEIVPVVHDGRWERYLTPRILDPRPI